MKKPSIIYLMFENILYTIANGMLHFIIVGGIALWVLNYLLEEYEQFVAEDWSLVEILGMVVFFFGIGLIVA